MTQSSENRIVSNSGSLGLFFVQAAVSFWGKKRLLPLQYNRSEDSSNKTQQMVKKVKKEVNILKLTILNI
ncbi:hypothetical protein EDM59_16320 [Brevibacillus nitrificans]|uniref:Uncharacterized protein n=1 Tax=Brevibacillus nitrificans TaxID=651560 RepID=A0A3M8D916_9BACL|nr:hypothetical protein EDM59_16320 [Brevibacillus nitrificans]